MNLAASDIKALPLRDNSIDLIWTDPPYPKEYLYCYDWLAKESVRVLKPGGLNIYTVRHTGDVHYRAGIHRGEDMYEMGGFIVHFFSREKVEILAKGYEIVSIDEFEEGGLPRKLFQVTLRKK